VEVEFSGLTLLAAPGVVMIPRPATEALVEAAAGRVGDRFARVADVGTGAGAIAVALAVRAPYSHVWATDVSGHAVALTRRNARRHGVENRVHVLVGDLLDPIEPPLDLVVANLPYLPDRLAGTPGYEEYGAEPREAIYAPGSGVGPYLRLLDQAERRLRPGGGLLIQFHRRVLESAREEIPRLRSVLRSEAAYAESRAEASSPGS
jgi:release factor glutamine methyltransferase